jgi:hypothetical protein
MLWLFELPFYLLITYSRYFHFSALFFIWYTGNKTKELFWQVYIIKWFFWFWFMWGGRNTAQHTGKKIIFVYSTKGKTCRDLRSKRKRQWPEFIFLLFLEIFYVFLFFCSYIRNQPTNTKIMPADFKLISPRKTRWIESNSNMAWKKT